MEEKDFLHHLEIALIKNSGSHYLNKEDLERQKDLVLNWLHKTPNSGIWWSTERSFPNFSPITRYEPYILFYIGTKPVADKKRIAIIGTRKCNYQAYQDSFKFGLEASVNNWDVVTGLAEGCDQCAAYGSIAPCSESLKRGVCIGVLANGLDLPYPSYTASLKEKIIENGGCIISRQVPGTPPLKYNFPNRNIIVSALSDIILAVQAPKRSGVLLTCDFSLDMGKDVCVASCGESDAVCCEGTSALAFEGAQVLEKLSDLDSTLMYRVRKINDLENKKSIEKYTKFGDSCYFLEKL